jgi:uncharacterized damage-inducible protein DinB
MPSSLLRSFRRWFDYEKDSHAKVMTSLRSVPQTRRNDPACEKAMTLMAHIIAARQLWLFRFGVATSAPTEFFPKGVSLSDLAAQLTAMENAWDGYLAKLNDADLDRFFEYKSYDAGWFRSTIGDIVTQLFGHSWYHRGQIASLVRAAGGEPAVTDFVFWTREAIPTRST